MTFTAKLGDVVSATSSFPTTLGGGGRGPRSKGTCAICASVGVGIELPSASVKLFPKLTLSS